MDGAILQIVTGFHSGAVCQLHKQDYRIGSAPGADIILGDPGVEPEHVILRIERYDARIEATGGDIRLGAELLSKGHGCRLRYPFDLSLGAAHLRVTGAAKPGFLQPVSELIVSHPRAFAATAIGALLLLTLANSLTSYNGKSSSLPGGTSTALITKTEDVAEAARQLGDRLGAADIHGLKVADVGGRVMVTGVIPGASLTTWTAIQQWFDQTYRGRIVLVANVAVGESKSLNAKMRLQAIWFGERPYVITDDGVRRYEGGPLDDGWVIREIRDNHVLLAKSDQTLMLTYP